MPNGQITLRLYMKGDGSNYADQNIHLNLLVPTPTPMPTSTPTPTPTVTPSPIPTDTPTDTAVPTDTPTPVRYRPSKESRFCGDCGQGKINSAFGRGNWFYGLEANRAPVRIKIFPRVAGRYRWAGCHWHS